MRRLRLRFSGNETCLVSLRDGVTGDTAGEPFTYRVRVRNHRAVTVDGLSLFEDFVDPRPALETLRATVAFPTYRAWKRLVDAGYATATFPANVRLNNGTQASPTFPNCSPSIAGGLISKTLCVYDNAPYDALQPETKLSILSASARFKASSVSWRHAEDTESRRCRSWSGSRASESAASCPDWRAPRELRWLAASAASCIARWARRAAACGGSSGAG